MKPSARFSENVVLRANAQLIEQHGHPTRLPRELLGVFSYRPRTVDEVKAAFASAYANLHRAG
jgi:hypothetical protein